MEGESLKALAELLDPRQNGEEEEEELDHPATPYATPAAVGPATLSTEEGGSQGGEGKSIWGDEEVSQAQQYEYDDPRPQPEYSTVFRQTVGAEDVFLGLGRKTPATASCPHMVVRVVLPGAQLSDVQLDISNTFLDCRTPSHRLGLHLPHRVQTQGSRASWLADRSTLEVCLALDREYDLLNQ